MAVGANGASNVGKSMGDWLLQLWPDWAAGQGLEPPTTDVGNGSSFLTPDSQSLPPSTIPAGPGPQGQVANPQPNPAPQIPPPNADNNPILPPLPADPQQVNAPAGMSFNGAPNQVQNISAAEQAQADQNAAQPIGAALSGVQPVQNAGLPYPGAPGVPGTRAVDANLAAIIQALTQQSQQKKTLSNSIR